MLHVSLLEKKKEIRRKYAFHFPFFFAEWMAGKGLTHNEETCNCTLRLSLTCSVIFLVNCKPLFFGYVGKKKGFEFVELMSRTLAIFIPESCIDKLFT